MSYTDTDFEKPAAASHTPGPWETGQGFGTAKGHAICAGSRVVAKVTGLGFPVGSGWHPQSAANAALIAAAPDLLTALKKCESVLSSLIDTAGSLNCDRLALKSARAAIAQAEGRTP